MKVLRKYRDIRLNSELSMDDDLFFEEGLDDDDDLDILDTDFSDDGNDNKWVDWLTMTVNNNAYYPIKKKPAEKDHIITLSTCSGKQKGDSYRFVVHSLVTDTVIYEE